MDCDALRDDQWERLEAFVPGGRKGGPRANNRRFLNALLWMARFRESLARFAYGQLGRHEAVKRRYYR